jgi:hypothetical protein
MTQAAQQPAVLPTDKVMHSKATKGNIAVIYNLV